MKTALRSSRWVVTVGDIESQPFFEAISVSLSIRLVKENAVLIHVTLIPYRKHPER